MGPEGRAAQKLRHLALSQLQLDRRGKIVESAGLLQADLGPRAVPPAVSDQLRSGRIRSVRLIGQGTAADTHVADLHIDLQAAETCIRHMLAG